VLERQDQRRARATRPEQESFGVVPRSAQFAPRVSFDQHRVRATRDSVGHEPKRGDDELRMTILFWVDVYPSSAQTGTPFVQVAENDCARERLR
jgi:hypothetical protein